MAGKYGVDDDDLLKIIKDLQHRVSKLERTPQTANAGVDTQGVTVNGGSIFVRRDEFSEQGLMSHGSNIIFNGDPGMMTQITRAKTVQGAYFDSEGTRVDGNNAFRVATVDGTAAGFDGLPTIEIFDKAGDHLITDAEQSPRGFGRPELTNHVFSPTLFTSTSSSFTDIGVTEWYMYHPHLRFMCLVQNDASTVSEINVSENGGLSNVVTVQSPGGTNAYVDVIVRRLRCAFGGNPNGNTAILTLQIRRVSGAGTVHVGLISCVGIDLSFSEPLF